MRLGLLLCLVPSLALGQGITTLAPGQASAGKVLLSLPFATPGCYASGTYGITFTRATVATYVDANGDVQTCSSGEFRVGPEGLLVEPQRTNFVLNSTTHPKTTEATASLGTGAFVARHAGTGTMTVVAGTATVTGLSCSAVSAGTFCTGTVTVAGTLTITTTAGTTRAQIETGAYPTSWIDTGAGSVQRNADFARVTNPIATGTTNWCVSVTATPNVTRQWTSTYLWALGNGSAANTANFNMSVVSSKNRFLLRDGASVNNIIDETSSHSYAAGEAHRFTACAVGETMSMYTDGVAIPVTRSGAGTLAITMPASMGLGDAATTTTLPLGGFIKNFKVCKAKSYKECK